jgi:hypothetical protein
MPAAFCPPRLDAAMCQFLRHHRTVNDMFAMSLHATKSEVQIHNVFQRLRLIQLCMNDLQLLPDIIAIDIIATRRYGYICYSPLPTPFLHSYFHLLYRLAAAPRHSVSVSALHSIPLAWSAAAGDPVMAICPVVPPSDAIDGCRSAGLFGTA